MGTTQGGSAAKDELKGGCVDLSDRGKRPGHIVVLFDKNGTGQLEVRLYFKQILRG